MDEGKYYSIASVLASTLSQKAKHTLFQKHKPNNFSVGQPHQLDSRRERFVLLMQTVFSAVSKDRFLLRDNNVNIYRLAFCLLNSGEKSGRVWVYVLFSIFLQLSLMAYVCTELVMMEEWNWIWPHFPLALSATLFAMIQAWKELQSTIEVRDTIYVGRSFDRFALLTMDAIANLLIPIAAVVLGFLLIITQEGFINGVLNTAALLFISEIDDQLPEFLEYANEDIVRTFVVQNAENEYKNLPTNGSSTMSAMLQKGNIEYSDIMVTNSEEAGLDAYENSLFGPIDVHSYATLEIIQPGCLLKEVGWLYQYEVEEKPFSAKLKKGNVVFLRLVTLGDEVIEMKNPKFTEGLNLSTARLNTIKGVYMLTSFEKARSVQKLRLCGSPTGKEFKRAMDYYNLWSISATASDLLDSPSCNENLDNFSGRSKFVELDPLAFKEDCECPAMEP